MSHLLHLKDIAPQNQNEGGYRLQVSKKNFPLLQGVSFYKLSLNPYAVREPHWHANADELGCCIRGEALVSIYATGNAKETFLVQAGDVFYVPSGSLHAIQTVGEESAEFILLFSNEEPEDFGLSGTFGMFTNAVLGNTWSVPAKTFQAIPKSTDNTFISMLETPVKATKESRYDSPYRYHLEGAAPLIASPGGQARVARKDVWPVLERQAIYSLHLNGTGMREPHWHPETVELGYVHKGKGRMSILSPSGKVDTYEMNEGDIYFIPPAYPHHIENLTGSDLQLYIFFDQAMPGDIGFTGSVKSNSNDVLASVLKAPKTLFEGLPTYYEDLFIVQKTNPVDK